ncbi:MAG: NAD(P)/FAD-dependent oxidoreductase, partial [Myxococcota bacterium]|nr:NAD(P)/FAD-dependent oxidoreductase [Myxococcota bacterium]
MQTYETIVVGGGPAGSTCAGTLKRNGHEVAVLDMAAFPRTKLCAGWVTPKALADLELSPDSVPGLVELTRMNLHWGNSRLYLPVPAQQYSIRRSEFDHFLLQRHQIEPIEHHVRNISFDGSTYQIDDAFRCTYLVGAGGTQCPVKRAFFPLAHRTREDLAIARELEYKPDHPIHPHCHLWWLFPNSPGYAWYVPKRDAVNIGYGYFKHSGDQGTKTWNTFTQMLTDRKIIARPPSEKPKGWSYYLYDPRLPNPKHERSYLIGDALGLATADLGEGI